MNSKYPLLDTFAWLAPLIGVIILIVVTISGAWSAANFSGGIFSGVAGLIVGLLMGLVAGAVLAFPYFIMGELSRALVELVNNTRASSDNTRELIDVLRERNRQA